VRRTGYTMPVALVGDSCLFADYVVGKILRLESKAVSVTFEILPKNSPTSWSTVKTYSRPRP